MRNRWTRRALVSAVVALAAIGSSGLGHAHDRCTVAALDGLYVFTASGFSIPTPTTSAPKAIVELIRFNGDGTLTVPGVTVSLNGMVPPIPGGETGTYTVTNVTPGEEACSGTLQFAGPGGQSFNLVFANNARRIYMIQTNPGNVFEGTAKRLSH